MAGECSFVPERSNPLKLNTSRTDIAGALRCFSVVSYALSEDNL